jgi:2-polyprenyl-3-methyl-5-hydroxy-6-metoxy-1,4-benzoquinol methylase
MIFADVLEHLPDPLVVLRALVQRLPDHGLCLISLPNVRHHRVIRNLLLQNEWEYTEQGVCDATHLRFFTARSAVRLCREAGLRVLAVHVPLHRRSARLAGLVPASTTFLADHVVLVAAVDRDQNAP